MLQAMKKMSDMMTGVEARKNQEHEDFVDFLEALARSVSPAASKAFGNMSVGMADGSNAGIELTAADFGWWRENIRNGGRFASGVSHVKQLMYNRMCKAAEAHDMNAEERAALIDLIKQD